MDVINSFNIVWTWEFISVIMELRVNANYGVYGLFFFKLNNEKIKKFFLLF